MKLADVEAEGETGAGLVELKNKKKGSQKAALDIGM